MILELVQPITSRLLIQYYRKNIYITIIRRKKDEFI